MPEHEEHCLHSEKRYGIRGDEIHSWMDEPSSIAGVGHRQFRHGIEDLPTAIQMFGRIYGEEMVENIFLDHLKADSEENRKRNIPNTSATEPYFDQNLTAEIRVFRYKRRRRIVKISLNMKKGCSLVLLVKASGGNNDVKVGGEMIYGQKTYKLNCKPKPFQISNTFSTFTDKTVEIEYQVFRGFAYSRKFRTSFVI